MAREARESGARVRLERVWLESEGEDKGRLERVRLKRLERVWLESG